MSDQPTDGDLGPKPEAVIEPGEPNPGGADALPEDETSDPVPADLPTDKNPAVDTTSTPTLEEGEDTSTRATAEPDPDAGAESDTGSEDESPA